MEDTYILYIVGIPKCTKKKKTAYIPYICTSIAGSDFESENENFSKEKM